MPDGVLEWPFEEYNSLEGEDIEKRHGASRIHHGSTYDYAVMVCGYTRQNRVRQIIGEASGYLRSWTKTTHPFMEESSSMYGLDGDRLDTFKSALPDRFEVIVHEGDQRFQFAPRRIAGVVEVVRQ